MLGNVIHPDVVELRFQDREILEHLRITGVDPRRRALPVAVSRIAYPSTIFEHVVDPSKSLKFYHNPQDYSTSIEDEKDGISPVLLQLVAVISPAFFKVALVMSGPTSS
jgi:hypothetical protein